MKSIADELAAYQLKPLSLSDICNVNDPKTPGKIPNLTNLCNLKYVPMFSRMESQYTYTPLLLPATWKQFVKDISRKSLMENSHLKKMICQELKAQNLQELHDGLYKDELEAYFVFTQLRHAIGKAIKEGRYSLSEQMSIPSAMKDTTLIDSIEVEIMKCKLDSLSYIYRLRKDKSDNLNLPDTVQLICKSAETTHEILDGLLNSVCTIQTRLMRMQCDVDTIKLNSVAMASDNSSILKSLYEDYNADETESTSAEPAAVTTIGDVTTTTTTIEDARLT